MLSLVDEHHAASFERVQITINVSYRNLSIAFRGRCRHGSVLIDLSSPIGRVGWSAKFKVAFGSTAANDEETSTVFELDQQQDGVESQLDQDESHEPQEHSSTPINE